MKGKVIREKKHRLPAESYIGTRAIAFTGCVKKGVKENLITKETFAVFQEILLESLLKFDCEAYVYLFMPDHFHFILKGDSNNSNIKKCIELFKQKSGYWLSKNLPTIKWQKDYYDHIIRSDESLKTQIRYILNNPVRAGIVEDWKDYSFKGSTVFDFGEWDRVL